MSSSSSPSTTFRVAVSESGELARRVVASLAPQELATFDETAAAVLRDPRRARKSLRGGRPLQSGLGSAFDAITAVAILVSINVVAALSQQLTQVTTGRAARLLRRLTRRSTPPVLPPASELTRAQIAHVHDIVLAELDRLGIAGPQADDFVAALLRALVLGEDGSPPE